MHGACRTAHVFLPLTSTEWCDACWVGGGQRFPFASWLHQGVFQHSHASAALGLLSAHTTGASATERRGKGEVDVLLGVKTDNERGNVHDLLADADVTLTDEDTGVVDGLGKTKLVDASLQATLQEVLDLQGKDVIELHAALVEDTDTDQTANESIALEETLGVLLVKSEELTMGGVRR